MKQTLHLLAIDVHLRTVMAAAYGSRWLLPMVTCGERSRPLPLVARWLTEHGISGDVAGQWLGFVTDDTIDWLVPIPIEPARAPIAAPFDWHALDALASRPPVFAYQRWALARTLEPGALPFVDGPFGNLSWPHDVRAWIGGVTESPIAALAPYRAGAHEVVVGAASSKGRVYFKGLTQERAAEARLTRALAAVEPESFAPTLALVSRPDDSVWWLAGECRGRPDGSAHRVAQALARIQQRFVLTGVPPELPALDLEAATDWASGLLGASPRCIAASGPQSWIPMDLDPSNVLVDRDGGVRFIDVDDSFVGAVPLAMAVLAARCGDRSLYRTYEQSWSPRLSGLDWTAFERTAAVVQSWLGWKRLERNIAKQEVFVDVEVARERTRARLSRAIDARSRLPATQDDPAA